MRRTVLLLLSLLLAAMCLAGCGERVPPRQPDEIVGELIACYGKNGEAAGEEVERLLDELRRADREQAALWQQIMAYWRYADTDMPVNTGALPEGLPEDDTLCIVVLGYALMEDGSMREELIGRLETALACAQQYPAACVLCTGGGTAAREPQASEAGKMGEWLLTHGLESDRLLLEDRSLSTVENAQLSLALLQAQRPQVRQIAIVSSSYHVPWGAVLFEAAFLKAAAEGAAPEMHVTANCGYPTVNAAYPESEIRRWQMSGLKQLFGLRTVYGA